MEFVEVTADNLNALVERWYALAKTMEDYSELNELVYTDIGEVPDDEFRSYFDSEGMQLTLPRWHTAGGHS
jgi:hypothetical protein